MISRLESVVLDVVHIGLDKLGGMVELQYLLWGRFGWLIRPVYLLTRLELEVDGLGVELAELIKNETTQELLYRIPIAIEHLKNLWDPEDPDPSRHLVNVLL